LVFDYLIITDRRGAVRCFARDHYGEAQDISHRLLRHEDWQEEARPCQCRAWFAKLGSNVEMDQLSLDFPSVQKHLGYANHTPTIWQIQAHHLMRSILLTQMIPGETSEVTTWVSGTDSGWWYNARAHCSEMWNLAFQTVSLGRFGQEHDLPKPLNTSFFWEVPCYSCSSCNSQNNQQLRLTSKWWTQKSSSHWMTQKFASFVTRLAATMDDLLYDGPSLTWAHQNDSLAPTFMCTYLHVHKQPFRVYLFRGHGGDLGLGGTWGQGEGE